MKPIDAAQQYFDAWNAHDPMAVIATFAPNGTYSDPTVEQLTGDGIGQMVQGLLNMFPDLSFEIASKGTIGDDLIAAEWLMHGTHKDTGKQIALPGSDFIRVEDGRIRSVQGYFDTALLQRQLGLEVTAYPAQPQGRMSFGTVMRVDGKKKTRPGAISLTWIGSHSEADQQYIGQYTEKIVGEMVGLSGFLGIMIPQVNRRGYTLTAWENVEDSRQLLRGGQHKESMKWFFGTDSETFGMISVWELHHARMMVRCSNCRKVVDVAEGKETCACGKLLPETPTFL